MNVQVMYYGLVIFMLHPLTRVFLAMPVTNLEILLYLAQRFVWRRDRLKRDMQLSMEQGITRNEIKVNAVVYNKVIRQIYFVFVFV
jgi:hypothetical protein